MASLPFPKQTEPAAETTRGGLLSLFLDDELETQHAYHIQTPSV